MGILCSSPDPNQYTECIERGQQMGSKRPVVLYGANGFSGRLVAEFLREFNVPFIAAGRNRAKIQDVMNHVPGIETADYEIAETAGSVDDLVKLFTGARVVCNTVGPFLYHGPRVIEACLKAGCHYVDIGGEQAWHREVEENWGEKFARQGLLAGARHGLHVRGERYRRAPVSSKPAESTRSNAFRCSTAFQRLARRKPSSPRFPPTPITWSRTVTSPGLEPSAHEVAVPALTPDATGSALGRISTPGLV